MLHFGIKASLWKIRYLGSVARQRCRRLGMLHFGIKAKVQSLSLDGSDKWPLEPRFQVENVSKGTNFEPRNIPECQEVTLVVLRSLGGVVVLQNHDRCGIGSQINVGRMICS
jgi:hypothetical protein